MLRDDVLYSPLQLVLMGFNPCTDGDLLTKVAHGYGEDYIVLTHFEEGEEHIFERHGEDFLHIQVVV
jgi:hypothetical protein